MTWLSATAYGIGFGAVAGFEVIGILVTLDRILAWLSHRRDIRRRLDAVKDRRQ